MPYITQEKREKLDGFIGDLAHAVNDMKIDRGNNNEGNMNYAISQLIIQVYGPTYKYRDVNDIVGMLECAKLEFYRKVASPYEDEKESENGKVY